MPHVLQEMKIFAKTVRNILAVQESSNFTELKYTFPMIWQAFFGLIAKIFLEAKFVVIVVLVSQSHMKVVFIWASCMLKL